MIWIIHVQDWKKYRDHEISPGLSEGSWPMHFKCPDFCPSCQHPWFQDVHGVGCFPFFFFFNTEINDLTQFQYFWCAVGRRRGRTWWLSGEQLLKGSWESQKLSSAVTVWADKMGVRGSADSKAERPVHQTPEKAVTGCALRTPQARGHSTERRVPAGCALEGGVILRARSWGSTESRLPWPGALKYHSARFTKSNNGSFEWHFKIQTFYFL